MKYTVYNATPENIKTAKETRSRCHFFVQDKKLYAELNSNIDRELKKKVSPLYIFSL